MTPWAEEVKGSMVKGADVHGFLLLSEASSGFSERLGWGCVEDILDILG